jgi:hypothetical protein
MVSLISRADFGKGDESIIISFEDVSIKLDVLLQSHMIVLKVNTIFTGIVAVFVILNSFKLLFRFVVKTVPLFEICLNEGR